MAGGGMSKECNRMGGDSAEGIKEELIQLASRPQVSSNCQALASVFWDKSDTSYQSEALRIDKSPGNDGLHPRVLREVAQQTEGCQHLGSPVIKQINKSIAGFIKSHKHMSSAQHDSADRSPSEEVLQVAAL
ncbi:hypothetical protein Bbelb_318280 [Branchiostoma belcheri]|nr:hypothetical protein Bbelb_318280 [Branchiostoma belcheri]